VPFLSCDFPRAEFLERSSHVFKDTLKKVVSIVGQL